MGSQLPDDWTYLLGQAFLAAAVSCGAVCDRRFVADGTRVEGLPPGCGCQLAVVVSEGWEPLPNCGARRQADVRLVLDLCTVAPDEKEVAKVAQLNAQAQANAAMRWAIMRGLRQAWRAGDLSVCGEDLGPVAKGLCGRILPGSWRPVGGGLGYARWEAAWRFQSDE